MPVGADDLVEITLRSSVAGQSIYNVYQYRISGSFGDAPAIDVAEGWWNHVSGEYRALLQTAQGPVYQTVLIRDLLDPDGDYAEYSIPVGERTGTRALQTAPDFYTTLSATAIRLSVGSRVTRPGQKRIFGATESDVSGNTLQPAWLALVQTLADTISTPMVLGAPVLAMELQPIVVSKDVTGAVQASQNVTGNLVNPFLSSQVSRKQR